MILGEIQFLDEITLLGTFFRDSKKVFFFFSRKSLLRPQIERKSLEKESFAFLSKKKKSRSADQANIIIIYMRERKKTNKTRFFVVVAVSYFILHHILLLYHFIVNSSFDKIKYQERSINYDCKIIN